MAEGGEQPFEAERLDQVVDFIVSLASGHLEARLAPSAARDELDAIIAGMNMLAEDLQELHSALEQRVEERTASLEEAQADLKRLAMYDPLTGLANRSLLGDRLQQALRAVDRGRRPPAALLLDLDGFKVINDTLGHSVGDAVLVEVARRLEGVVRPTDTVARLGGDEFAIVVADASQLRALEIADRVIDRLRQPVQVGARTIWTQASIGIRFGLRGQTPESLLRDADTAMYAAKAAGKGNAQVFRPAMHEAALARLDLAAELRAAMAGDRLALYYQPIVELTTGRLVGAEALAHWAHEEQGFIPLFQFIPIAEDSGLIVELGHWVLERAVHQLKAWGGELPPDSRFRLSVNLSPVEFRRRELVDFIRLTLEQHAVDPKRLSLEITETGLMAGANECLETLRRLRRLGVGLAIDDFGTGYSSISYLRRLPVDTVKIDRSLVADITEKPGHALLTAVLQLIESVGLRAVAEGIETPAHVALLGTIGCHYGQGYHFGRPMPADEMLELLVADRRRFEGQLAAAMSAPGGTQSSGS